MKSALIIPTYNAAHWLDRLIPALGALSPQPDKILFIDSSSGDGTAQTLRAAGYEVHVIRKQDFGHGKTRNLGAALCPEADMLIYMTQDALPAAADLVARMIEAFARDEKVAVICGRQLPHEDATLAARYARLHNYPPQSRATTAADIPARGIKALFCSNSFAAYRARALKEIGGFPEYLPLGEDMAAAGRLLEAGYTSLYLAEACVRHSHNYSLAEEFRRYFDIGALLHVDPWLKQRTLKSGGEGMRYVLGELKFMAREGNIFDIVGIVPRTLAKYAGFMLGAQHERLPPAVLRKLSMHQYFWKDQA